MKNTSFLKLRSFFSLLVYSLVIFILLSCSFFQRRLPDKKEDAAPKKYKEIYKIKAPPGVKNSKKSNKVARKESEVKEVAIEVAQEKSLLTPGEVFVYTAGWTMFSVGTAEVSIEPSIMVNDVPSSHIHVLGKTNEFFSGIYNAEINIDLFMNAVTLKPYKLELNSRESKFLRNHIAVFDYVNKKASYWSKSIKLTKSGKEKVYEAEYGIMDDLIDSLSPAFQVRKWTLQEGKKIAFHVLENEKIYKIQCDVLRKEKKEVLQKMEDAFYVECVFKVVKAKKWKDKYKEESKLWAWFSDDPKHYLIEAGAKVTVGSVSLQLIDRK